MTIAGKANLRLLPTPILTFTDIRIGDGPEPEAEIERFRAEVELAPLLKGEVRIIQMSLERPFLRLDIAAPFGTRTGSQARGRIDPSRVSLAEVEIFGGSARIADGAGGRAWEVTEANGVIAADSLRGPAKIDGSLVVDGEPFDVSAALGTKAGSAIPAKLTVESHRLPITLAADGRLDWSDGGALTYLAAVTVAGAPQEDGGEPAPAIWDDLRAKGTVALTRDALAIEAAQLTYGATERPLVLEGSGRIDLGDAPSFNLDVSARQIDLAGAISGGSRPPAEIAAELATLLEAMRTVLPGRIHLSAQGVLVRGGLVQAVRADVATASDGWQIENISAVLPGDTRIEADGMLGPLDAPAFQGWARIASRRPAGLAAWWRGATGSASALGSFAIESDVDVSAESQTLSNLRASIGEGSARGSIAFYRFREPDAVAGEAATRFADVTLSADRLDAIEARAFAELLAGNSDLPDGLNHVTLSLRADVLTAGDIEARSVVLDGGIEGGELQIRQVSVADLAGAAISASGTLTGPLASPSGSIEAKFDAENLAGAADFISRILPESKAAAWLDRGAPRLSPALADISARLGGEGGEHAFDLTGSFADTHLTLDAAWTGTPRNLSDIGGRLALHIDGADSAAVLRQLGIEALPIESGPLVVDANLAGRLTSEARLTLTGTMAGIAFDYEARATGGNETLTGAFTAESDDTGAALLLTGLVPPGLGESLPASASGLLELATDRVAVRLDEGSFAGQAVGGAVEGTFGDGVMLSGTLDLESVSLPALLAVAAGNLTGIEGNGIWNDGPLVSGLPPALGLDLHLTADTLDLGLATPASAASMDFALSGGALEFDIEEASFAGGPLSAGIDATLRGGEAEATLRATLSGGSLNHVVWNRNGAPVASGVLDASFEAETRGRSVAGLVSALSGSGSFTVRDGSIASFNPEALPAVMQLVRPEEAPDGNRAREIFFRELAAEALSFDAAEGSFAVEGGVIDVGTVTVSAPETILHADASINLNALTLSSRWTLRVADGGTVAEQSPLTVPIRFSGPIENPAREIDLNPLFSVLNSRYEDAARVRLEELEAERRRMEEEEARRQAEAEKLRLEVEERQRQRDVPAAPPIPPGFSEGATFLPVPTLEPDIGTLLQALPAIEERAAPQTGIIDLIGPAVDDMMTGASP